MDLIGLSDWLHDKYEDDTEGMWASREDTWPTDSVLSTSTSPRAKISPNT